MAFQMFFFFFYPNKHYLSISMPEAHLLLVVLEPAA